MLSPDVLGVAGHGAEFQLGLGQSLDEGLDQFLPLFLGEGGRDIAPAS